jgi:hypothetical protein
MKEKFQTFRGKRGLDVKNINDDNVQVCNAGIGLQVVAKMFKRMKYQL